jgi:heme exporter protein B
MAAAVVLGVRRGGVLLPLLVLPLATPVLIFGTAAGSVATGLCPKPGLLLLCAALAIALLAAGGAHRLDTGVTTLKRFSECQTKRSWSETGEAFPSCFSA